jgi:hypothetical protein
MAPLFLFLHLRVLSFETLERWQSPSLLLLLIFVPVRRQAIALPDPGQATSTQQIFCYYSADIFLWQGHDPCWIQKFRRCKYMVAVKLIVAHCSINFLGLPWAGYVRRQLASQRTRQRLAMWDGSLGTGSTDPKSCSRLTLLTHFLVTRRTC